MSISTSNLIQVINAGGRLSIDANDISTNNLIRLVNAARLNSTDITLRNLSDLSTTNLKRIVQAGQDKVTIEV